MTDKLHTAIEIKERVATHSSDHDPFTYHVREAPVVEAVAELTDIDQQFSDSPPNGDRLKAALDCKERLAAHGMKLPEEEALWREQLEDGVRALNA